MKFETEIERIRAAIQSYEVGRQFTVKSLFPDAEWKEMEANDRRALGKAFSCEVKAGSFPHVKRVEAENGQSAHYEII